MSLKKNDKVVKIANYEYGVVWLEVPFKKFTYSSIYIYICIEKTKKSLICVERKYDDEENDIIKIFKLEEEDKIFFSIPWKRKEIELEEERKNKRQDLWDVLLRTKKIILDLIYELGKRIK